MLRQGISTPVHSSSFCTSCWFSGGIILTFQYVAVFSCNATINTHLQCKVLLDLMNVSTTRIWSGLSSNFHGVLLSEISFPTLHHHHYFNAIFQTNLVLPIPLDFFTLQENVWGKWHRFVMSWMPLLSPSSSVKAQTPRSSLASPSFFCHLISEGNGIYRLSHATLLCTVK